MGNWDKRLETRSFVTKIMFPAVWVNVGMALSTPSQLPFVYHAEYRGDYSFSYRIG